MVDRYLSCPRVGCGGVAIAAGADLRSKNIKYTCQKCGNTFAVSRSNFNFGRFTFALNDPNDHMRGGMK